LETKNESFLEAIEKIFISPQQENKLVLYLEQKEMLMMSDADIENGNVVLESELDKLDSEWLY
jgi:predicted SAM-dependent methyltransferase